MTIKQKIRLLSGKGTWRTYDCDGLIPEIFLSDGPHGLRKQEKENFTDVNQSEVSTCFPTASAIACSWDPEISFLEGDSIAAEALEKKVSIVLGCGNNIKRSPLCGRNFEYFSEDPFLSGTISSGWIKGLQRRGVGCSLKHFAGNNQETRRQTSNSQIDERALREIYLAGFELSIKESSPLTIMASYNKLNGKYSCANKELLTKILRDEWGFKGLVISDWGAVIDVVECIKAGLDLEMPDSNGFHTNILMEKINEDSELEYRVEESFERIISIVEKLQKNQLIYQQKNPIPLDYDKQNEIARKLECNSAVLLKKSGMFPLCKGKNQTIVIIGELAEFMRFQGGGSSHITTRPVLNVLDALKAEGFNVLYSKGYRIDDSDKSPKALIKDALNLCQTACDKGYPVLFFGGLTDRFEGEGYDRKSLSIPFCQISLLERMLVINWNISFVAFGGSPMVIPFRDKLQDILLMYLGGQAVGLACTDLITGKCNPCGKLAETFPLCIEDTPCNGNFAIDSDDIEYRESIFVGYRFYETFNIPVQYEFGYGLSYTEFNYSNLKVCCDDKFLTDNDTYFSGKLKVLFNLKNCGNMDGAEISQVYIINPEGKIIRAKKELCGFKKTFLNKGEEKGVEIELSPRSFSVYSVEKKAFVIVSGKYEIMIGSSVKDEKLIQSITVKGEDLLINNTDEFSDYFYSKGKKPYFSKEQFQALYRDPLSHSDKIYKGEFSLKNSFSVVALHSLLGRIILFGAVNLLYFMNRKKRRDDPSVQMVVQGLKDNPLESLICCSDGLLPVFLAEALVMAANGHSLKAIYKLIKHK